MKNINLLLMLMLTSVFAHAQGQLLSPEIQQISPLTPNAAAIGKYGNIPVSLYTGIPNIQIPIYEIKAHNFSLPISLSYHASGVRVDDVASWVGLGWSLNAGGMINRQQRGVEDYRMVHEKSSYNSYIQTILDPISTESQKKSAAFTLVDNRYDTESDIFSINAGSLSQKFFMDPDENIYCMPARKLAITPESSIYIHQNTTYYGRWRVKDEKGVEYIFGKTLDNLKEEVEIVQSNEVCGTTSSNPQSVSSWYLNEIILPNGETITFSYDYFTFCVQNTLSETHVVDNNNRYASNSTTKYIKALRIKEILFPQGKVEFIAGDLRRDFEGTNVLKEIKIYANESGTYQPIKSFVFETNNPVGNTVTGNESFRLALLSITEQDANGNALNPHIFKYKNQTNGTSFGLPSRGSYQQDIWGYYNGKLSNTSLVPNFLIRNESGQVVGDISGADRSVNTELAQFGILTEITYPTGGTTKFTYESNIAKGANDTSDPNFPNPLANLYNMDVRSTTPKGEGVQVENTNGFDQGYSDPFEIYHEAGVEVSVSSHIMYSDYENQCTTTTPGGTGSFFECMDISLEKRNQSGVFESFNNTVYFDRTYFLFPGEYRIKLAWNDNDSNQIQSWGYVNLNWIDLEERPSEIDENSEMVVGGLRVSKIVDYDPVTNNEIVRNFDYDFDVTDSPLEGTSGMIQYAPLHLYYKNDYYLQTPCTYCAHVTSFTNSPTLQTEGGFVGYKKVTVSYGVNGEGGKSVSTFSSPMDYLDDNITDSRIFPFKRTTSFNWRRGFETGSTGYEFESGTYTPVESKAHDYTFKDNITNPNYKSLVNIKVDKFMDGFIGTDPPVPSYNGIYSIYNTATEWYFKHQTIATLHYSGQNIASTTNYHFENPIHLQPTRTETINSRGEREITDTYYPDDVVSESYLNGPNLSTEEKDALDKMKTIGAVHQTTVPVQVETYYDQDNDGVAENNELLVISRTNFKDWDPQAQIDLVLPTGVTTLKGQYNATSNPMEDRIAYHHYDSQGNPTEVSKDNGPHTYYIWGYHGQYPIAKIDNFETADIDSNIQTLIDAAVTASENDDDTCLDSGNCDEKSLRAALENLRSGLPSKALMVSYTYDPLIGLTSVTDPRGYTMYYEYDSHNRLKEVKDGEGNLVSDYKYHFKGQSQ